jgi:hypothetical protein
MVLLPRLQGSGETERIKETQDERCSGEKSAKNVFALHCLIYYAGIEAWTIGMQSIVGRFQISPRSVAISVVAIFIII